MANRFQKPADDNNQYMADWFYVKQRIFIMSEDVSEAYADYWDKLVNKNIKSPLKLARLNRTIIKLYTFIKPKLDKHQGEKETELIKQITYFIDNDEQFNWEFCKKCVDVLQNWLEQTGLTKLDIELTDPLKELEAESYGETS